MSDSRWPQLSDEEWIKELEAVTLLKNLGYGIIAPNGDCEANVGIVPDGGMILSTKRKPYYGMLNVHTTAQSGRNVN